MHPYSTKFKYAAYVHLVLGALAIAFYQIAILLPTNLAEKLSPLTVLTIFVVLELLFNLWGWKLLCLVPFLKVYNFEGHYEGKMFAGKAKDEHPVRVTISQNWRHIEIDFWSESATSKSFSAAIELDRLHKGQIEIIYNYFVQGNGIKAHYGTAMLTLQGDQLHGDYYTEQQRNSHGKVSLCRRNRQQP